EVQGKEKGRTEPKATLSTCCGAQFLPLPPSRYATMLGDRIKKHQARVWRVNTGWTGGPYGVGRRMKIGYTRAMIRAALSGALDAAAYERGPIFNLHVPVRCPSGPPEVPKPRGTWASRAESALPASKPGETFRDHFKT